MIRVLKWMASHVQLTVGLAICLSALLLCPFGARMWAQPAAQDYVHWAIDETDRRVTALENANKDLKLDARVQVLEDNMKQIKMYNQAIIVTVLGQLVLVSFGYMKGRKS